MRSQSRPATIGSLDAHSVAGYSRGCVEMAKHRFTVVAIGLLASVVFMYLAMRRLDFGQLRDVWSGAHVLPWIPIGIASYLLGHIVRGHRCRLLVRREATLGLLTASNVVVVGYASNNVFPARLGELVRAGMLAQRTGIPVAQSLTITFIERVLDGLAILLLLVLGTLRADVPGWIHDLVRVALLVFGTASIAMVVGAQSPGLIVTVASRIGNRLGEKWHDRLVSLATSIANAGACLRDPRTAIQIVVTSVLVWTLEAGLFVAIMPAFGIKASLAAGAVAMSVTNLGLLVPSSPGFIGPFHFFCSRALMAQGVDENVAVAYATVVHLAFYIPVTIWGAVAMVWYGVEVGAMAAMSRAARVSGKTTKLEGLTIHELAPLAPVEAEPRATPFTIALVEALVVPETTPPNEKVVRDASQFVEGQLKALHPQLRSLFEAGMTFFRFVTRLRYLRGYCNLSLDTRRSWTKKWSDGRISLLRQLFRPVRATALLAYYDHPDMRASLVDAKKLVRPRRDPAEPAALAESPP